MKAKVLYVVDNLEFGGGERGFAQLAGAFQERWEVLFACHPGGPLGDRLAQLGIRVLPLDFRGKIGPSRLVRLVRILKSERVHLVHSMGARADFSSRIAARLAGTPVVVSTVAMLVEGYDAPPLARFFYGAGDRLSERWCHGFIAVSEAVRRALVERHGIPAEKVATIYSGVELEAYRPEARNRDQLMADLRLDPGAPLVGTVGRLVYQKAHDVLLEAAAIVGEQAPRVQFLIVGEGPFRARLERLARERGLRTCRFAGLRADIPALLAIMDVFVLPSILEGLPRVLLEAWAAARPVVATRIDGVTEVAEHGVTALLVPPGQPRALAEAVLALLEDRELARRLGEAGRQLVQKSFALSRTVQEVGRFYDRLLHEKGVG